MFRWYHSTIPKLALAFALVFGFRALLLLLFLVGGWLSGRFLGDLLTAVTELLWSSSPARYLPASLFLIYFIGAFAAIGSRMLRARNTSIREWNGRCDPEPVIKLCIQQRKQLDGIARERAYCRELCALQATAYSSQGDRELAVQLLENSSELPGAHPDSAGLVALYVYAERAVYQKNSVRRFAFSVWQRRGWRMASVLPNGCYLHFVFRHFAKQWVRALKGISHMRSSMS